MTVLNGIKIDKRDGKKCGIEEERRGERRREKRDEGKKSNAKKGIESPVKKAYNAKWSQEAL